MINIHDSWIGCNNVFARDSTQYNNEKGELVSRHYSQHILQSYQPKDESNEYFKDHPVDDFYDFSKRLYEELQNKYPDKIILLENLKFKVIDK